MLNKILKQVSLSSLTAEGFQSAVNTTYFPFDESVRHLAVQVKVGDIENSGQLCASLYHCYDSPDANGTWNLLKGIAAVETTSGSQVAFENSQPPMSYGKLELTMKNLADTAAKISNITAIVLGQRL